MNKFKFENKANITWINKLQPNDRQWAIEYLKSKGVSLPGYVTDSPGDIFLPNTAENREIERNLRNAWRQRKLRSKLSGRKPYSFILTNDSKIALDKIAKDMHSSTTAALELIIKDEDKRAKEQEAATNELKKETKIIKNKKHTIEELEQTLYATRAALLAVQEELEIQIMRTEFNRVDFKSTYSKHIPTDLLKEEILESFKTARKEALDRIGTLSIGLPQRHPDIDKIWEIVSSNTLT